MLVKLVYRQPHDIVETSVDSFYADSAYPFLDSICPGFVIGTVFIDVIIDFFIGEIVKCDFCLG